MLQYSAWRVNTGSYLTQEAIVFCTSQVTAAGIDTHLLHDLLRFRAHTPSLHHVHSEVRLARQLWAVEGCAGRLSFTVTTPILIVQPQTMVAELASHTLTQTHAQSLSISFLGTDSIT